MMRSRSCLALAALVLTAGFAWPAPARAIGLPETLRHVLRRNPELGMLAAEATASRARAVRAGSWSSPMVEFGVINVPTTGRFDADPMTMKMVGVVQRVPVFGANRLARRAGNEAANADTSMLAAMRWQMCGVAWEAYVAAFFADERTAAAARHAGTMKRMVEAARARYASGRGRLDDVLRAEAEQASVAAETANFTAAAAEAHARLAALAGAPASQPLGTLEAPPVFDVGRDPRPWLDAALGNPQLGAADASVRRYELEARAARRMAWPELELRASYGFRDNLAPDAQHLGPPVQENMFSATAGLMVPLFAGSREFAEAREMTAMANAATAQRAATTLELERSVTAAHAHAIAGARTVRLVADTVLVMQRKALEAAWSGYSAGAGDLMSVFETAHSIYGSDLREIAEREHLAKAHAMLVSRTGRFDLIGLSVNAAAAERRAR